MPTQTPPLMQVWIDSNCGIIKPAHWEENSEPKPLEEAIEEARQAYESEFPIAILPIGVRPWEDDPLPK